MNLAIDLDNTLFINDIVETICDKHNVPHSNFIYDLSDLPEHIRNECFDSFNNPELMCGLKPIPNISSTLWFWDYISDGFINFHCVSARSKHLYNPTKKMIDNQFPMIKNVVLVGSHDKSEIYKDLNIDMVIDDNSSHMYQALDVGVKYNYLISNKHTSYNFKDLEDLKSRGVEIVESINKIKIQNLILGLSK